MDKRTIIIWAVIIVFLAVVAGVVYYLLYDADIEETIYDGAGDAKRELSSFVKDPGEPDAFVPMPLEFNHEGPDDAKAAVYGVDLSNSSIMYGLKTINMKLMEHNNDMTGACGGVTWIRMRNIDTGNPDIRYELDYGYIAILNYRKRDEWTLQGMDGFARDPLLNETSFEEFYISARDSIYERLKEIEHWSGQGNVVVSYGGIKRIIYDIEINQELPDELFLP